MRFLVGAFLVFLFPCSILWGAEDPSKHLTYEEFMKQVEANNPEIFLARQRIESARSAKAEPGLVFSPQAFAKTLYSDEKSNGTNGIQQPGDKTKNFTQVVGVNKSWAFGVDTNMSHSLTRVDIEGIPVLTSAVWTNQFDLEVRANLWKNLLGSEKWASQKSALSLLDAEIFSQSFNIESLMVQAEATYWKAAFAQERKKSLTATLKRARAILAWNEKRRKLNVADQGDVLQSKARVLEIEQALESSLRAEKEARRALRFFVSGSLSSVDIQNEWSLEGLTFDLPEFKVPETWSRDDRLDLRAIAESREAAVASAKSAKSGLNPQVDLYAQYGGRSADMDFGEAESQVFDNSFRRYEVGLELSVPLFVHKLRKAQQSKDREVDVAQANYRLAEYRLEQAYENLRDQLQDLQRRIRVAIELKETQRRKLANEDNRFRQGRSSSFQVLSFQEDLADADLGVLSLYVELRQIMAQMKLFGVYLGPSSQN